MEEEDAPEQQRAFATGADDITSTLAIEPLTSEEEEDDEEGERDAVRSLLEEFSLQSRQSTVPDQDISFDQTPTKQGPPPAPPMPEGAAAGDAAASANGITGEPEPQQEREPAAGEGSLPRPEAEAKADDMSAGDTEAAARAAAEEAAS